MSNRATTIGKICGMVLLVAMTLGITFWGVDGIVTDLEREPLARVEESSISEPLIREVLAWYYEDGTVEDEQGQLWYYDKAVKEGQLWRMWISDNGTPNDVTDDIVIDCVGG